MGLSSALTLTILPQTTVVTGRESRTLLLLVYSRLISHRHHLFDLVIDIAVAGEEECEEW